MQLDCILLAVQLLANYKNGSYFCTTPNLAWTKVNAGTVRQGEAVPIQVIGNF